MGFWARVLINAVSFLALTVIFQSFHIANIWMALIASFVLAILNALVKPVLQIISLPITFLTLGLFSIVINAVMLQLTSAIVGSANFGFTSFGSSILVAICLSLCNMIISDHYVTR